MFTQTAKPSLPKIVLQGFRISMRPPTQHDWLEWAEVRQKNKLYLEPFEPEWATDALTEDYFRRRLKLQFDEWQADRARAFLIFKWDGDELIGGMNINNICRGVAQYASLGYWISENEQGQGYMAEALKLTVRYCFENLKLHRVNASCLPHNERSKNLLLKGGFTQEGFAEKYLQINKLWQDHILFGLPIERWRDQARPTSLDNMAGSKPSF